jgi:hypothetical protein
MTTEADAELVREAHDFVVKFVNDHEAMGLPWREFAVAVASFAAEVRQRETTRAAGIADKWALSHSCKHHTDDPCCHVRTGAAIASAIRAGEGETR